MVYDWWILNLDHLNGDMAKFWRIINNTDDITWIIYKIFLLWRIEVLKYNRNYFQTDK